MILRFSEEAAQQLRVESIRNFVQEFNSSATRAQSGRGAKKFADGDAVAAAQSVLDTTLGQNMMYKIPGEGDDAQQLSSLLGVSTFAADPKDVKAYTEPEAVASLRLQFTGERCVALCSVAGLAKFMATKSLAVSSLTGGKCAVYLKTMSRNLLEEFSKSGCGEVFFATVGPRDCLYTPGGFATVEELRGPAQMVGLCIRGHVPADEAGKRTLEMMATDMAKSAKAELVKKLIQVPLPVPVPPPAPKPEDRAVAGATVAAAAAPAATAV
eukprot:15462345-Alexandrium_andersonii.AAC.1